MTGPGAAEPPQGIARPASSGVRENPLTGEAELILTKV